MYRDGIGTHLDPQWLFDVPESAEVDPNQIVARIRVTPSRVEDVIVTRGSGLFVQRPEIAEREHLEFLRSAVDRFNLVICELSVNGVVSLPASTAEIASVEIGDQDVRVRAAAGAIKRRSMPDSALTNSMSWREFSLQMDGRVLDDVQGVPCATSFAGVATSLPHFVSAAYTFYARRLLGEGLINTWIAIEQVLNHLWQQEHVAAAGSASRRKRLNDGRTYSAAVQIEVLQTAGVLDSTLADRLHQARVARNKLAHDGTVETAGCDAGIESLVALLERVGPRPVRTPHQFNEEIPW